MPVKVGNVCDSDLVTDLLRGEAGGGKQTFCGCHTFVHDVATERRSCFRTENVGQVVRVHVDFLGDGGAAQFRIGKMRTDIVLDDADRVRGMHHGFVGGLLEHTLSVTKNCDYFAATYPILNRDLIVSAAIFHDIGKLEELSTFPENDYTDEGQLLGHIMIGAEMVGERIRTIPGFPKGTANELKHCILAHHGELEYGSPKKPALAEALALSFADNIDAKMETIREIFASVPENNLEWQGYNRLLESNIRRSGRES